jgi:hypothetical protein
MNQRIATHAQQHGLLKDALRAGALVRITRRRMDMDPYSVGYPLCMAEQWVLLHKKSDRIDLDGYELLRLRDITAVEMDFPHLHFYRRALDLKGEKAVRPPGIDLSTLENALTSISEQYPLLTISREKRYPDEVAIGRLRTTTKSGFHLEWITPDARLEHDSTLYRYSSVTKVEFGGEYEETLALVAGLRADVPWQRENA